MVVAAVIHRLRIHHLVIPIHMTKVITWMMIRTMTSTMDHLLMDIHPIRDIHQVVVVIVIDTPILEPSMDRHIIHHLAALDVEEEDVVGPIFTRSTHHRRRVIVVHIIIILRQ
jgi:hypothetical protein